MAHFVQFQKISRTTLAVVAIIIAFGWAAKVEAQTPLARFVLPTNTTETAVQPTFRIITKYKIDTSSVRWNWNWIDSIHADKPILVVMPYDYFTANGDTIWQDEAMPGTGSIINDTTIEFTSDILPNFIHCEAVLMGLRVVSGVDTISVPDTVAQLSFTTIDVPVSLLTMSTFDSGGMIRTHDTVTIRFDKKLDSANAPGGPLCTMDKRTISVDSVHGTLSVTTTSVPMSAWLDSSDSSVVHALPTTPFDLGDDYFVSVNVSNLTGDSTSNVVCAVTCRESYRLNITPQAAFGLTSLPAIHFSPAINEQFKIALDSIGDTIVVPDSSVKGVVLGANDTATFSAPSRVACAKFWKWSCPEYPSIDNSTDTEITISETSDQLYDINPVALYKPVPMDSILVGITTSAGGYHPYIEIQSDTQECHSLVHDSCSDTCSYLVEENKAVTLRVNPDGLTFAGWNSSDANVDGSTSEVVTLANASGNSWAIAHFGTLVPPIPGVLTADIEEPSNHTGYRCATGHKAFLVSPTALTCSTTTGFSATIQMNDNNWGLQRYDVYKGGSHTFNDFGGVMQNLHGGPYSVPSSVTDPNTDVVFTVAPLNPFTVTVVIETDDGEVPNGTGVTALPPRFGGTIGGALQRYWVQASPSPTKQTTASGPNKNEITYTLTYPRGTDVHLACYGWDGSRVDNGSDWYINLVNQCYSFIKWEPHSSKPNVTDDNGTTSTIALNWNATATNHNRYVEAQFLMPFRVLNISNFEQWPRLSPNTERTAEGGGDPTATGPIVHATIPLDNWSSSDRLQGLWSTSSSSWPQSGLNPVSLTVTFSKPALGLAISGGYFAPVYGMEEQTEYGQSQPADFGHITSTASATSYTVTLDYGVTQTGPTTLWPGQIWKGQNFKLIFPSAITATDGSQLCSETKFLMSTENPDIKWFYAGTQINILNHSGHPLKAQDNSVTYWLAHQGIDQATGWTSETACEVADVDRGGGSAPDALTGWSNIRHNWGDRICSADGNRLMISCPHCSDFNLPSAGIQNVVMDEYYDIDQQSRGVFSLNGEVLDDAAEPTLNTTAHPHWTYMGPPASNLDKIGSNALEHLALPALTSNISGQWSNVNNPGDFIRANHRAPQWWGGGSYPQLNTGSSNVLISVSVQ